MDIITVLAIICTILVVVVLLIAYKKIRPLKPRLSVEVIACKHGLRSDGGAFLLRMDYRFYNHGKRNTIVTSLEAHLIDTMNNLQTQTLALGSYVGAAGSTTSKALYSFVPPFSFTQNLNVHFILYHTYGREVFMANSTQSDPQTLF